MPSLILDISSFFMRRIEKAVSCRLPDIPQFVETASLSILRLADMFGGDVNIVAAMDDDSECWRTKIRPGYQCRHLRAEVSEELVRAARRLLAEMGIPIIRCPGMEADDAAASLAVEIISNGGRAVVASNSLRLVPLLDGGVSLVEPFGGVRNTSWCRRRFGIEPRQMPDYMALVGLAGVAGTPGIGHKRAKALLSRWPDLESMLAVVPECAVHARVHARAMDTLLDKVICMPFGCCPAWTERQKRCAVESGRVERPASTDEQRVHANAAAKEETCECRPLS